MTRRQLVLGVTLATIAASVSVDRLLVWHVERAIAARVGCAETEADVKGFPVIGQVVGGRLDDVVLRVPDLSRAGVAFDVHAELEGLQTDGGPHVDRATVTATVAWSEMASVLEERGLLDGAMSDAQLEAADDSIAIVLGGAFGARLLVEVALDGDEVEFRPIAVEIGGRTVSPETVARLTGQDLDAQVRSFKPELPAGFDLVDAAVSDDGVAVTVLAEDVETGAGTGVARICGEAVK